jgi:uncharacterized membrane protein (DUF373 family)
MEKITSTEQTETPGKPAPPQPIRNMFALAFSRAEDVIYIGLGILLAGTAFALLIGEAVYFANYISGGTLSENIVFVLDRILLVIIFVEVLYTVQVSFRQHTLQPEPFLVVGLIAVTRRILVLTAELSKLAKETPSGFQNSMIELGLLTVLILALVVSLRMSRQDDHSKQPSPGGGSNQR